MIIPVSELPDHGYGTKLSTIDIHPMTFKELLEYNEELNTTYVQKLYRDIKYLRLDIGDNIDELSYYNLDSVIFLKKAATISKSPDISFDYKCPECGSDLPIMINTDKLSYTEFNDVIKSIEGLKIGNTEFKIRYPLVRDVLSVLDVLMKFNQDINPEILLLCSIFKEFDEKPNYVKSTIENAIHDDILSLKYLATMFNGSYKQVEHTCPKCNKRSVIRINRLMTDIFRLLQLNFKIDKTKIIISKTV